MSDTLPRMTEAEYLAWEERQELKYEFDGMRPSATVGVTADHDVIQFNLKSELMSRLRGTGCKPLGPEMRVPTGRGRYRYPDVVVTCSPIGGDTRDITEPAVIFEVLSDTTYKVDKGVKLVEYRSIPSLARYVMVEQASVMATVIARVGGMWSIDVRRGDEVLELPEIGIELPLRSLYAGVALPQEDP